MSAPAEAAGPRVSDTRYSLMELAERMTDVVSLGRGDPDLHTDPSIVTAGMRRLAHPLSPSPVRGLPALRARLARHYRETKDLVLDPESQILITNGAQEGLFLAMLALVRPGDGVLVPDPRYSSYDQAIQAAGGTIVEVPTSAAQDFRLEASVLDEHAHRGRLLVFVNPSNPTGSLVPPDQVRAIAEVARRRDLAVISDEIYENLVFDGGRVQSVAALDGMAGRTITLSGFSKTYAMTGFRVGYLIGPPSFIEAAAAIKAAASGPCAIASQAVALAALDAPDRVAADLRSVFADRRRVMLDGLTALGIPFSHAGGGFYVWADISRFGLPAESFCRRLLEDARVLMFPGSAFGERWASHVRLSLLQPVDRLEEALRRLGGFIATLDRKKEDE